MPNPTPNSYGVTPAYLWAKYFAALPGSGFSTASVPSLATVTQTISEIAAEVNGVLAQLNINGPTIQADGGGTMPNAWAWLTRCIGLGVAAEIGRISTGISSAAADRWEFEYHGDPKANASPKSPRQRGGMLGELERNPSVLTDAPMPSTAPSATSTFVDDLGLTRPQLIGQDFEADVLPKFRMDDQL